MMISEELFNNAVADIAMRMASSGITLYLCPDIEESLKFALFKETDEGYAHIHGSIDMGLLDHIAPDSFSDFLSSEFESYAQSVHDRFREMLDYKAGSE